MNEDDRINPISLPPDRYTDISLVRLYAITHRLDATLSEPNRASLEWRSKYRTLVCDFLDFFDAKTPDLPCTCDTKSRE
jgi:hypothetical protein